MSDYHSYYRDNYKSHVYHARCQVIAWQDDDIRHVTRDNMANISTSSESISSDTRK